MKENSCVCGSRLSGNLPSQRVYAKIETMRKIFLALLIGIMITPVVDASWRRTQPTYSFQRAEKTKSARYTRARWRTVRSPYQYRFSRRFKRTDRLLWRTMEPGAGDSSPATPEPKTQDFCNYHNSIIGEYLPSAEVKNRCCECLDGWKCQYSTIAGGAKQHNCDPDWEPPDTTGE